MRGLHYRNPRDEVMPSLTRVKPYNGRVRESGPDPIILSTAWRTPADRMVGKQVWLYNN